MKTIFLLLCVVAGTAGVVRAQCPEIPLNELQYLQKIEPAAKEAKIRALGFDLHNEFVRNGATFRGYNKCWQTTTTRDQAIFDQKIIWNVTLNAVMFLTLNPAHFDHLRLAVGERHPEAGAANVVIGKMFRYEFSIQRVEGIDYYALTVSSR